MEKWKNIGAFLTGVAALLTALVGFISHVYDSHSIEIENKPAAQRKNKQLAFVNDPDGWVNLRALPSSISKILTTLDNGDKVEVMSVEANWIRVKTNQNIVGYIFFDRLEFIYE